MIAITIFMKHHSPSIVEATAFAFRINSKGEPVFISRTADCDREIHKAENLSEMVQIAMTKACTRLIKSMYPISVDDKEGDPS